MVEARVLRNIGAAAGSLLFATAIAAEPAYAPGYAEDRAMIEDLQARYAFALDFRDADTYASMFTEDGVLDWARGVVTGREAIRALISTLPSRAGFAAVADAPGLRPAAARHHIVNQAIRIEGNRATARAYWFQFGNDNPEREAELGSYGHYEDELIKIDGQWYFTKRRIYNEQMDERAATGANPAW
ncbi:MAG: nuclear transport factor 2 family protein [Gammaproteobacteria bacterium]|nr:nuclear transport factor 2 family protein [Gammaproteobacteria bacterium]